MKTNYKIFKESYNNDYNRVIPRSFFNESMLLKCLGRLCVMYLDTKEINGIRVEFEENGEPFNIVLDGKSNKLYVSNYRITVNGNEYMFGTEHNARYNYPFFCIDGDTEIQVFTESGEFDQEFIEYFKTETDEDQ